MHEVPSESPDTAIFWWWLTFLLIILGIIRFLWVRYLNIILNITVRILGMSGTVSWNTSLILDSQPKFSNTYCWHIYIFVYVTKRTSDSSNKRGDTGSILTKTYLHDVI